MPNKSQTYDSSGPDIRVRGNAYQVLEKYLQLARDAGTAGDRVAAENFLQHADHYYRVVSAMNEGQRPRIGGREISVADVNVQNVSQGLSAALSGHGHSNGAGDDGQPELQPGNGGGNSNGSGQNRPQHQQHPQSQAPRDSQGNGQNGEPPQAAASESSGNSSEEPRRFQQADDQPDYPEELLPSDQQAQPNGDGGGQFENRQGSGNRMGRGRRRGPGRRVRAEGDEQNSAAPAGDSDGGAQ
jgi:hypothetical protein